MLVVSALADVLLVVIELYEFLEEFVGRATLSFTYFYPGILAANVPKPDMVPEVPFTFKHRELIKNQRFQLYTFANINWIPRRIAKHLNITPRQIQYVRSHRFIFQK